MASRRMSFIENSAVIEFYSGLIDHFGSKYLTRLQAGWVSLRFQPNFNPNPTSIKRFKCRLHNYLGKSKYLQLLIPQ